MLSDGDIKRNFPLLVHLERQGIKVRGNGKQRSTNRCPAKQHGKEHFCVSIDSENELFHCHSCETKGSIVQWLAIEQGKDPKEVFKELASEINGEEEHQNGNGYHATEKVKPQVVATYDYTDENGELIYQSVRYHPKSFRQRRPDPVENLWHWNMDGVTRVPYHLPEVIAAKTVVIVEGEKDADNLTFLGFVATTSVGGAKNWLDSYADFFIGKDVIVCPDNDEAGKDYAKSVVKSLEDKANSVKLAHVPSPSKDISDYIETLPDILAAKSAIDALFEKAPHVIKPIPLYTIQEMEQRYIARMQNVESKTFDLGKFLPSLGGSVRRLVPGELVAIMAGTAVGKTALMQGIARAAAPLPTVFFELELPAELMFERFVQMEKGCYGSDVETDYSGLIHPLWQSYTGLTHILTCPESGLTVQQIESYIKRSELKIGTKPVVVFVDYVGLVRSGVGNSRYEEVSYTAEQLKVIAKRTETIIFFGTQIHRPEREGKKEKSLEVSLHDGKDSGSIENSAGLVIGAWRPEGSRLTLKVLKNTKGTSGQVIQCRFDGAKMQISELPVVDESDVSEAHHHYESHNGHNGSEHVDYPEQPEFPDP